MPSDPTKPLLRLNVKEHQPEEKKKDKGFSGKADSFPRERQLEKFRPIFDRLVEVMTRPSGGLELAADPNALAPECLLVFEVRGSVQNFLKAAGKVAGLDFVDAEEFEGDADDKEPMLYLYVPDEKALMQIASLVKTKPQTHSFKRH